MNPAAPTQISSRPDAGYVAVDKREDMQQALAAMSK